MKTVRELIEEGTEIVATPESFPESVLARIREIADSHPEIEVEIGGGLADSPVRNGSILSQPGANKD